MQLSAPNLRFGPIWDISIWIWVILSDHDHAIFQGDCPRSDVSVSKISNPILLVQHCAQRLKLIKTLRRLYVSVQNLLFFIKKWWGFIMSNPQVWWVSLKNPWLPGELPMVLPMWWQCSNDAALAQVLRYLTWPSSVCAKGHQPSSQARRGEALARKLYLGGFKERIAMATKKLAMEREYGN